MLMVFMLWGWDCWSVLSDSLLLMVLRLFWGRKSELNSSSRFFTSYFFIIL